MSKNMTTNPDGSFMIIMNGLNTTFNPTNGLTGYNRGNNTAYGNLTILVDHDNLCTPALCDYTLASFTYRPNIGGNAFFMSILAIYFVANIYLGIRHKTWGYMAAMSLGLIGEVIGYLGRILLWDSPFDPTGNYFLVYLVCLTIAPAFLSAAIYLCLARIVVVYGEHLSRFRPRTYTLLFCSCDALALVLQAAGGGIASAADTQSDTQLGINVMLAGLSAQVASILLFAILCAEFAFRLYRNPQSWTMEHTGLFESKLFKAFICGLCAATLMIFVRSVYRVAELSEGFHGSLANNEILFMILEGAMIVIATSCLTFLHPGVGFQGAWAKANFTFRKQKRGVEEKEMEDGAGRSAGVQKTGVVENSEATLQER